MVVPGDFGNTEDLAERESRLIVLTVTDGVGHIPGLFEYLDTDTSVSTARCPAIRQKVVAMCRQLAPCIMVADSSFLELIDVASFVGEADIGNSVKCIVAVDVDDPERCQNLLKQGFAGTVRRDAPADIFRRVLQAVAAGELWAPRKVIASLVRGWVAEDSPRQLTGREKEILQLIAGGYTNREIADALFITRETVRWHVRSIYAKLGASDRESAIRYARMTGNVTPAKPAATIHANESERKAAS